MATFLPGNKLRAWANGYRISKITDAFDINRMAETYDVTNHETQGDKAFIAGLRTGGTKWAGIFDASTEYASEVIAATLGSTAPNVWTVAVEGDAVGKVAHVYTAREKMVNISAPAAGRIGVQGESDATDHILTGKVHRQGTAATASTGASASVDNGVASTLGGTAHFHVTDTAAALGSITAKIQHSSAGVSWADLITFTSTTNRGQSIDSTGLAIKRFTRAIVTSLSGASTVYLMAAFARKTA